MVQHDLQLMQDKVKNIDHKPPNSSGILLSNGFLLSKEVKILLQFFLQVHHLEQVGHNLERSLIEKGDKVGFLALNKDS